MRCKASSWPTGIWCDYHQLAVDAYGAQHAPRGADGDVPPISVPYSLVGLHLALDRCLPGLEVRAAHRRMGKPDASWPRLRAPVRRGAVTVWDVAAAGSMAGSVAGHANAVRGWAASVWQAWASQHGAVTELTDRLLR